MSGTTHASWYQYSRWGWVIARTMRINQPDVTKKNYVYEIKAITGGAFEIEGTHILEFKVGDIFKVQNSTGNDGEYTVDVDATYDNVTDRTTVVSTVPAPDATADGEVLVENMEEAVVRRFVLSIWDAENGTGSRPWLASKFVHSGTQGASYKVGDAANEPVHVLVKLLQHAVRDLKKTPLRDVELPYVEALFAATGNRRYGYMGNLI